MCAVSAEWNKSGEWVRGSDHGADGGDRASGEFAEEWCAGGGLVSARPFPPHALGIPEAHEFVEVGDRNGIVFERVDGPSLFDSVRAKPWTLFRATRVLADLHARIHRCPAPAELPFQREWIASGIDESADLCPTDRHAATAALDSLPAG